METLNIPYSLKNIPIPTRFQYQKALISKVEKFVKNGRWKMLNILNPRTTGARKETYGFNSLNSPPQIKEFIPFETELYSLVANIKYKPTHNRFQDTLKADKEKVQKMKEVIVHADKTSNLYLMEVDNYKKKVVENITTDYKKSTAKKVDGVTKEAARIARSHDLEDRMDTPTESEAFITIKDHKSSFPGKVDCRLINPAKNHVSKISKHILDRINTNLRKITGSNQWQSTSEVLDWFNNISNKSELSFFKFDIVSFYPSISEDLLMSALNWAKSLTNISEEEIDTIIHCRRSSLYYGKEA